MPQGFYGQFLGTIGAEFEGIGLPRESVASDVLGKLAGQIGDEFRNINLTRDASTEFNMDYLRVGTKNLKVSLHTRPTKRLKGFVGSHVTMGYELFTNPLTIPQMERLVYPLLFNLQGAGDFISARAATHFHVGFANNLRLLKNMLRISLMLDPVLYRLGGMGGKFRGFSNLAAYARPLMNSAAVPISHRRSFRNAVPPSANVSSDGFLSANSTEELEEHSSERIRYASVINPIKALEAMTVEEFWLCFGVICSQGAAKYHPARYSGTNFIAIPHHGTIEFRHFNQSHDPRLIMAIAKFLRGVVEMSTLLSKSEASKFEIVNPNHEISASDGADIMTRLLALCQEREVEDLPTDYDMEIILETLQQSSFEALPETPVKTHIRDFTLGIDVVEIAKLAKWEKVLEPKQVDIHNIDVQSIFD